MTVTLLPWGIVSDRIGERLVDRDRARRRRVRARDRGRDDGFARARRRARRDRRARRVGELRERARGDALVRAGRARARARHPPGRDPDRRLRRRARAARDRLGGGVHAAFVALAANAIVWAVLAGVVLRERHVDEDIAERVRQPAARPAHVAALLGERARARGTARDHGVRRAVPPRRARLLDHARRARARRRAGRRRGDADRRRAALGPRRAGACRCSSGSARALAVALAAAAALVARPDLSCSCPLLVVAGVLGMSWNGLSFTAAAEAAGPRRSGAAIGFQQTVLGVGGIVIPIAFAAIVAGASWRVAFFARRRARCRRRRAATAARRALG